MSSSKTTTIGLILGVLVAVFGALQPMLDAGTTDLKVIIPAVVIAGVMYLEKENGSWKTTLIGSILAALAAGASVFIQNQTVSWIAVIGAVVVAFWGKYASDHKVAIQAAKDAASGVTTSNPQTGPPTGSSAPTNP